MSREKFLLYMLAGIFAIQAGMLTFGIYYCAQKDGFKTCPDIAKTYEQTFNVMIATTLALLTGSALRKDV